MTHLGDYFFFSYSRFKAALTVSQCLVDMFHINIIPTFCFDQFSFFFYSRMQFLRFSAGFYLFILETIVELLFLK